MLLAGDIGGTKTNLAIISPEAGPRAPLAQATFPSLQFSGLEPMVREFLSRSACVERASFGVAGPVVDGRATITNLPWVLDERQLKIDMNVAYVRLLNDMTTLAHAVPFRVSSDLETLSPAQPEPGGAIGCSRAGYGAGRGLSYLGRRALPASWIGGRPF